LDDSRFTTARDRAINSRELIATLDEIFATKTLAEWAQAFDAEPELFWSPVNSMEDVLGDEQFHAAGGLVDVPDEGGSLPMIATPADFHGTPWAPRSTAPKLGEHTEEILAELQQR
jgi:crotonobetainyl-CoA:carnitine CoA-transferase CaiB-like acyl-CoA transferase